VINLVRYRSKHKRSVALQVLLFPVFVFIGVMGWLLYLLGDPEVCKAKAKPKKAVSKADCVTLMVVAPEPEQEIVNRYQER
jgi:hypothetical protein